MKCVFPLQDELMYMLRKLLLNIGDLPAQTSHILFNYLVNRQSRVSVQRFFTLFVKYPLPQPDLFPGQVGLIMYFVRTPCEWGMDAISATLTFLWEVVGYVEGLFFKDLKQTMKKEQCEVKLLVTASMPGKLPVPAQSISCFSLFVNAAPRRRVTVERALRLM